MTRNTFANQGVCHTCVRDANELNHLTEIVRKVLVIVMHAPAKRNLTVNAEVVS